MTALDLREAWRDLLERRPTFAGPLTVYGEVVEAWARTDVRVPPLAWTADECRARWTRGVPLLAEAIPQVEASAIEALLSSMIGLVASVREDAADALDRLAEAWDGGRVTWRALLPAPGKIGTLGEEIALDPQVSGLLATGCLRPVLTPYLESSRAHLADPDWELGACPFCGAPPGFGDILENGRRRLACHVCSGEWTFSRLRCPFCGNEATKDLGRLEPEPLSDQGYSIATCKGCRGYLKELDRRVRWNGGPALVEDWGSPHFDLVAAREGYWRPLAPIILPRHASGT